MNVAQRCSAGNNHSGACHKGQEWTIREWHGISGLDQGPWTGHLRIQRAPGTLLLSPFSLCLSNHQVKLAGRVTAIVKALFGKREVPEQRYRSLRSLGLLVDLCLLLSSPSTHLPPSSSSPYPAFLRLVNQDDAQTPRTQPDGCPVRHEYEIRHVRGRVSIPPPSP